MRAFLGLDSSVSDADVIVAYGVYLAGLVEESLTLAEVKDHLRLSENSADEDSYLGLLILASRRSVENCIDRAVVFSDAEPDLAVIKAAMLLLIGHWYANREAVSLGAASAEMPLSVSWLLQPLRQMSC